MTNTVRRHSPPGAKRCAFTGYRPQKMPFGFNESDPRCIDFKRRVKETIQALYDMGYRHFISGGALGMDMFAAEAVLELRARHSDMILEMVSPFDDQAARWSPELRARHDRLFAQADITTATGHAYTFVAPDEISPLREIEYFTKKLVPVWDLDGFAYDSGRIVPQADRPTRRSTRTMFAGSRSRGRGIAGGRYGRHY